MRIQVFERGLLVREQNFEPEAGQNRIEIGRASGCHIRLEESASISRYQAVLTLSSDGWILMDGYEGSPSVTGVKVDGRRISAPVLLDELSEVTLFEYRSLEIRLVMGDETEPLPVAQSVLTGAIPVPGGFANGDTVVPVARTFPQEVMSRSAANQPVKRVGRGSFAGEIREELSQLRSQISQVSSALTRHEEVCRDRDDGALREIQAQVQSIQVGINSRLDRIDTRDDGQERVLRKVTMAGVVLSVAVAGLLLASKGDRELSAKMFDVAIGLLGVGGVGGGAALVMSQSGHHRRADQVLGEDLEDDPPVRPLPSRRGL